MWTCNKNKNLCIIPISWQIGRSNQYCFIVIIFYCTHVI
jgi:hypothetical protein